MHAKKTSKSLVSAIAAISLAFATVIGSGVAANATTTCDGVATPGLELISDPVFYTGLATYDANYIGYKLTTPSGWNNAAALWVKLDSFAGGRISLATNQPAAMSSGVFTGAQTGYTYFLAKAANDTTTTAQTHDAIVYAGDPAGAGTELCRISTSINSGAVSPAAASNNSNKVDSIAVSGTATNVNDQITVTVKGRTGTLGGSGRISFAPTSYSAFAADKWRLVSVTAKLKQTSSWADQGSTVTLADKLYWTGQGANDGYYTATYVFKMVVAATAAAQLKPIQYAESGGGLVYTGTMPSVSTTLQTATTAAAATYTVSFQKIVGGVGSAASGTFTDLTQASNGASVSLHTNPALNGYTFGGWSETDGGTTAVSNTYTPSGDITLYAIWTAAGGGGGGGGGAAAAPEPDRKVTICHRTHATTNPYVRITVDYNSVNRKSGHQGHDEIFAGEHVFKAGIYKRAKDKDWGDIIPADPSGLNRWQPLNWTTLGAAIYNGTVAGCPAYDAVKYYNALREAGVPEKQIKKEMADLETEQSEANPSREKKNTEELKYTGTNTKALEEESDKVTICHRTNSVTNPYVRITVAASSIYKNAGHYGHDEIYNGHHVFDSTVDYPNNKKDWGDIIPADSTGKNRWAALNMTTLGKAIYDGTVEGCAEKSTQQLYNELREEGKSKKEIIEELEKQKDIDNDPKDLDELTYTGTDPKTEKTEPKEPVAPAAVKIPDQSLSGIVWLDLNRDGLKDPDEPLMPNITLTVVQLTSVAPPVTPARAGLRAAAGVKAAAVTLVKTDANGFYLFPSLGAGDWQVVTTVPDALEVTYDSHATSDGEIITTVPVASHAFTWVGLVGDDPKVNKAIVDALEKAGPGATVKVDAKGNIVVVKAKKASTGSTAELAATGTHQLAWLAFGMLLMLCGALVQLTRKGARN